MGKAIACCRVQSASQSLLFAALSAVATTTIDVDSGSSSGAPIKLGFSAWPGWFPWQVAEEAGIFKQAGVNVELVWFEGYLDSINALAPASSTPTARR